MDYVVLKALHVAADLVWFGGIVLNGVALAIVASAPDALSPSALRYLRKWDLFVSNPAQGGAWLFGIWLAVAGGWVHDLWIPDGWLMTKLVFVLVLAALHGSQSAALRQLANGRPADWRVRLMRHSALVALGCGLAIPFFVLVKPV